MKKINITIEGRILDAISQAKNNMQKIVGINIPKVEHDILLKTMITATGKEPTPGLKIQDIYGVPVKRGKILSITLEI